MKPCDIPDAAYDAGAAAVAGYPIAEVDRLDLASDVLHAAVPHIISAVLTAELLELADAIDARALKAKPGVSVPLAQEAYRLRRRAAEVAVGR